MNLIVGAVRRLLQQFKQEDDGQALVEYALILGLVAVVVILVLTHLGGAVNTTLNNVANAINTTA